MISNEENSGNTGVSMNASSVHDSLEEPMMAAAGAVLPQANERPSLDKDACPRRQALCGCKGTNNLKCYLSYAFCKSIITAIFFLVAKSSAGDLQFLERRAEQEREL